MYPFASFFCLCVQFVTNTGKVMCKSQHDMLDTGSRVTLEELEFFFTTKALVKTLFLMESYCLF